jgi:protein farnesyltransferase subunit beta
MSIAQHRMKHSHSKIAENRAAFDSTKGLPAVKPTKPEGGWKSEEERQRARREAYSNVLGWVDDEAAMLVLGGNDNRLVSIRSHLLKYAVYHLLIIRTPRHL